MITTQKIGQRPKTLIFILSSILCLALIGAWVLPSFAQEDLTLSLSSEQGTPGQPVDLTLSLSYPGAATASGFQLDISYDTDVLTNPSATEGAMLTAAGKTISSSQPSSGVFRMVISGGDQLIQAGNAATISFDVKSDAPTGITDLILDNMIASEPDGDPLVVAGSNGSVEVSASIPTLSEWGVIIMTTILLGTGVMILRRRKMA